MPIHKNPDNTYSWGKGKSHGSFKSKAAAEKQQSAIYANGWNGDCSYVVQMIDDILATCTRIKGGQTK